MRKIPTGLICLAAVVMVAVTGNPALAASTNKGPGYVALPAPSGYTPAGRAGAPATWTGTLQCVRNCEGVPAGASFTFQATNTSSTRSRSCVPKTATGVLTITWDDGSTTVARDLLARSHGTKELAFSGTTDRTSDMFAGAKIKGTVEYPNSVSRETAGCDPGTALIQARIQRIRGAI